MTTTRASEDIAVEITEARTKLATFRADAERFTAQAVDFTAQRVSLLAEGKRAEAKALREALLDAEDEASIAGNLATRETERIQDLEREHAEATKAETRAKLDAAEAVV